MTRREKRNTGPRAAATEQNRRLTGRRLLRWPFYALIVPVLLLAVFLAHRFLSRRPPVSSAQIPIHVDVHPGYIDPAICASCHGDIAESFRHTGMGRSLYRPTISNRIEDYSVNNAIHNYRSESYYVMVERNGSFYQQRYQLGPDGGKINIREELVDYIVGSGDQARSYLHRDAEGRLIELPVTWYTEKRGYWQMTPGYDQRLQKDFHGPISYECFFCHDAYPRAIAGSNVSESGEPVFPASIPEGIDCQRCHGPGQAHVQAAMNANSTPSKIQSAIVNPARLSRERQLEVCMECHLSTSRSQDLNMSRRFGRDVFSYRPGQPLGDYKLYFDQAESEQRKKSFDVVDAAYRLSYSACFRNSQMTCLACHDPHVEDHSQSARSRYIAVCEGCHKSVRHTTSLSTKPDCISCHMPKRRSQYAVHIVLTDHYIQRNKPAGDLTAPIEEPERMPEIEGDLTLFYPKQLSNTAEDQLYLAAARLRASNNDKGRIHEFEQEIENLKPTQGEFYAVLGEAYAKAGDAGNAEKWLQEAHTRAPRYRPLLEQLVELFFSEGKYQQAADLLKQSLEIPPPDSALLADLANGYARLGELGNAEAALERAIAINPETAQAYNLLGLIATQRGDGVEAEKNFREALRMEPDLAEADNNLGKLLIGNQDLNQAEYYLKRSVTIDPKDADAHHSYGLLLMLKKEYVSSAQQLRQSISLDPTNALACSDLGDVLAEQRDDMGAVEAYQQSLKLRPDLSQANLGLGTILLKQGKLDEARVFCQAASRSQDDSIREAALRCMK